MKRYSINVYVENKWQDTITIWCEKHWISSETHCFSVNNEIILMLSNHERITYEVKE